MNTFLTVSQSRDTCTLVSSNLAAPLNGVAVGDAVLLQNRYFRLICSILLLKQGYRYHKIRDRKAFSKFYHRHSVLIVKYNIGLKTSATRHIRTPGSEPIYYGDLDYKFKRIVGKPNFSDQFKNIIKRYIKVGYNLDVMRQSACLFLDIIAVCGYGFLFNCAAVGRASDSVAALA